LDRRVGAPDAGGHFISANAATYPLVDAGRLTMEAKDSSTASVKAAARGHATGNQQALPVPLRRTDAPVAQGLAIPPILAASVRFMPSSTAAKSTIPKSGNRFSDKIMLDQKRESDSIQLTQTLATATSCFAAHPSTFAPDAEARSPDSPSAIPPLIPWPNPPRSKESCFAARRNGESQSDAIGMRALTHRA
jgi:hypothetical protein